MGFFATHFTPIVFAILPILHPFFFFCQNRTYYNTFDLKIDTRLLRVWAWLPQHFAGEVKEVIWRKVLSTWESSAVLLNQAFFFFFSFVGCHVYFHPFWKLSHRDHIALITVTEVRSIVHISVPTFFCAVTSFSSKVTCFKRLSTGELFLTSQKWAINFGPRLHLSAPDFSSNLCCTETYLSFSSVKTARG